MEQIEHKDMKKKQDKKT